MLELETCEASSFIFIFNQFQLDGLINRISEPISLHYLASVSIVKVRQWYECYKHYCYENGIHVTETLASNTLFNRIRFSPEISAPETPIPARAKSPTHDRPTLPRLKPPNHIDFNPADPKTVLRTLREMSVWIWTQRIKSFTLREIPVRDDDSRSNGKLLSYR